MSSLLANLARISSQVFKLGMFLVLVFTVWASLSVEGTHTDVNHATSIQIQIGSQEVHAATDLQIANSSAASPALKAADGRTSTTPPADGKTGNGLLEFANGAVSFIFMLFNPLLMLAGWLLTPDWVFGEVFGLRPILHQLWVLISNVVYIIFAFMLIGIAFMNIFGSDNSAWQIKTKLPKLIIGVITVPFTWFLVSAVTSIASILTASVIQMPADLLTGAAADLKFSIPATCTLNYKNVVSSQTTKEGTGNLYECSKERKEQKIGDFFKSEKSAYGVLTVYAYSIFNLDDLKTVKEFNFESMKTVTNVGLQVVVGLVFFVVFAILLLAIVAALFSRAVMLWIYAIFSPVFSLNYFFE